MDIPAKEKGPPRAPASDIVHLAMLSSLALMHCERHQDGKAGDKLAQSLAESTFLVSVDLTVTDFTVFPAF